MDLNAVGTVLSKEVGWSKVARICISPLREESGSVSCCDLLNKIFYVGEAPMFYTRVHVLRW